MNLDNLKKWRDKVDAFLDSEEGKERMDKWFEEREQEELILENQLIRANQKYESSFESIVDKIIAKYDSEKYVRRWYSRSIEPQNELLWFLLKYAAKYGRDCTEEEIEMHSNMFTTEIYYINGYVISRMDGQGSVVQIVKVK